MKFISLTSWNGEKIYIKADAITLFTRGANKSYVYTIGDDEPVIVKDDIEEIIEKIESEE